MECCKRSLIPAPIVRLHAGHPLVVDTKSVKEVLSSGGGLLTVCRRGPAISVCFSFVRAADPLVPDSLEGKSCEKT